MGAEQRAPLSKAPVMDGSASAPLSKCATQQGGTPFGGSSMSSPTALAEEMASCGSPRVRFREFKRVFGEALGGDDSADAEQPLRQLFRDALTQGLTHAS